MEYKQQIFKIQKGIYGEWMKFVFMINRVLKDIRKI